MTLFALAEKESYVFALTRDGFAWKAIPVGADALSEKIAVFRRGLDIAKASDASGKSGLFARGIGTAVGHEPEGAAGLCAA